MSSPSTVPRFARWQCQPLLATPLPSFTLHVLLLLLLVVLLLPLSPCTSSSPSSSSSLPFNLPLPSSQPLSGLLHRARAYFLSLLSFRAQPPPPSSPTCTLQLQQQCLSELQTLREWHAAISRGEPTKPARGRLHGFVSHPVRLRTLLAETEGGSSSSSSSSVEEEEEAVKPSGSRRGGGKVSALRSTLDSLESQLRVLNDEVEQHRKDLQRLSALRRRHSQKLTKTSRDFSDAFLPPDLMTSAAEVLKSCKSKGWVVHPANVPVWKGYACSAGEKLLSAFLSYRDPGTCPDDWPLVQDMVFVHRCFSLPKRRCLTLTSPYPVEPLPFPRSLFDPRSLVDENVRWNKHHSKSFGALRTRLLGDCRDCFSLGAEEEERWKSSRHGAIPMSRVVALKKGALRIGLDISGGAGSFAAHMARYGVTVMTSGRNVESGEKQQGFRGMPYMETIALRGLVPLHLPHKANLPFFSNTLDIIHCWGLPKTMPLLEFEEMLFEWDRVLRVGGVLWLDTVSMPALDVALYVSIIHQLGFKKLYWKIFPKLHSGGGSGGEKAPGSPAIYGVLNCVLEKPVRAEGKRKGSSSTSWLLG